MNASLSVAAASSTVLVQLADSLADERERLGRSQLRDTDAAVLFARIDDHLAPITKELAKRDRRESGGAS